MVDIILSSDDLSVLGGPDSISVEVDFGPTGERGSFIYANTGKPTTLLAPNAKIYDLYINTLSNDDEYQCVYQLQSGLGDSNVWVKLFRMVSNIYSKNYSSNSFTDGTWQKNIPLAEIVPADFVGTVTAANFNVQYSILNQNPVASSVLVGEIVSDNGTLALPITVKASELSGSSWVDLEGIKTVHLFITVINVV